MTATCLSVCQPASPCSPKAASSPSAARRRSAASPPARAGISQHQLQTPATTHPRLTMKNHSRKPPRPLLRPRYGRRCRRLRTDRRLRFLPEKGYRIPGAFNNVQELKEGDQVKLAGVQVGYVEDIKLENGKAWVTMKSSNATTIKTDSRASSVRRLMARTMSP